jgi:hemolysin activation/secretion protein
VRAYPAGEANATSGAILQTELRYARGAYAPFVFYDAGTIKADGQEPARSLSGYGVGLRMTQGPLQAAISIAWKGAGGAAQSDERQSDPTIWANISYAF